MKIRKNSIKLKDWMVIMKVAWSYTCIISYIHICYANGERWTIQHEKVKQEQEDAEDSEEVMMMLFISLCSYYLLQRLFDNLNLELIMSTWCWTIECNLSSKLTEPWSLQSTERPFCFDTFQMKHYRSMICKLKWFNESSWDICLPNDSDSFLLNQYNQVNIEALCIFNLCCFNSIHKLLKPPFNRLINKKL